MSYHDEVNNKFGTHDHEYDASRYSETKNMVRVETYREGGYQANAHYYITDTAYSPREKCAGQLKGEYHGSRCHHNGKLEYRDRMFCKTHHPPTVFKRKIERDIEWHRQYDRDQAIYDWRKEVAKWQDDCMQALITISEGELNDPAGYAAMVLEQKPERPAE